jgi:hypothetical protein
VGPDLQLLMKSIQESSVSSLFLERELDRVLVALVDYLNPLRQNMRREPGSGTGWQGYRRVAGITAGAFADTIDINDTDTIQEKTGTYSELYLAYKTIASRGRVGRIVQKTGRTVADLLREEIEGKARELADAEEFRMFWGASPTANTKQWPGLNKYLNDNTGQIVALTNTGTGVTLTLEALDQAIDLNLGTPQLILTSRTGRRKLNALLQAQQRFVNMIEINGGFKVMEYNGIPVLPCTNIPDTLNISSGGTVTALTGGSTTAFFIVDTRDVFMSVLTEPTMLPLARTTSQYEEFDMFMDETLVVRDYRRLSAITGVKARG